MESGSVSKRTVSPCFTLTISGTLKHEIDEYLEYGRQKAHVEMARIEVTDSMLWHFLEPNEEFTAWRRSRAAKGAIRIKKRSSEYETQTQRERAAIGTVAAYVTRQPQGIAGRIRGLFARQASARDRLQGGRHRDAEALR